MYPLQTHNSCRGFHLCRAYICYLRPPHNNNNNNIINTKNGALVQQQRYEGAYTTYVYHTLYSSYRMRWLESNFLASGNRFWGRKVESYVYAGGGGIGRNTYNNERRYRYSVEQVETIVGTQCNY